jgi:hypothetical protein
MIDEDMEKIMKEWLEDFLVLVNDVESLQPDIIGSPLVTQVEHAGQSSGQRRKRKRRKSRI